MIIVRGDKEGDVLGIGTIEECFQSEEKIPVWSVELKIREMRADMELAVDLIAEIIYIRASRFVGGNAEEKVSNFILGAVERGQVDRKDEERMGSWKVG